MWRLRASNSSAMTTATPWTVPSDEDLAAHVARRLRDAKSLKTAHAAFDQLVRRHNPLLAAFIASRTQRDAEDIAQDVWQRVWEHAPAQFQGGNFRAWLYQIARNALIDVSRKARPELLRDHDGLADPRPQSAEQPLIEAEHGEALKRCLERLKPEIAAFVRARLEGEDYDVLCERLGFSKNRAYKMMNEAKAFLQPCVERELS